MSESAVAATATVPGPRRRFRWTPTLVVGLGGLALLVLVAVVAPMFLTERAENLGADVGVPPGAAHWLGTDDYGRDMLARTLVATRLTMIMTVLATAMSIVGGALIGTAVWLMPRRPRELCLRVIEVSVSYPSLIIALILASILGRSVVAAVVAIGVAGIPSFARLTANLASTVSRMDYVSTARLLGVRPHAIITRHLLPNIAEPLLVLMATNFAHALIELSGLSFIGLGVQPPKYDYGFLLNAGLSALQTEPWQALGPAVAIVFAGLMAMMVGDGLAAASDPRQHRVLTRKAASEAPPHAAGLVTGPRTLLTVDNLSVGPVGGDAIVREVSFTIGEGEVVGVVGESGSGKSLTAMAVAGLLADGLESRSAALTLGDLDLAHRPDLRRMATEIALVYQDPGTTFNPALRLGSQLTEVLRTHVRLSRPKARARVVEALGAVQMSEPALRLRQHPHELSGGMRQRAMIAAALVTDPKLIIADEPTTALDVTVQAEVLRQFHRINRERGTAILFISHDIGVVQKLCDRVLVMYHGRLVEQIPSADLAAGRARHPYTRALMAAIPRLEDEPGRELPTVARLMGQTPTAELRPVAAPSPDGADSESEVLR